MKTLNMLTGSQSYLIKSILEGAININKPSGPTSFRVVDQVRKILSAKKAGHIGTLDPEATGVLPICLNRSTRIIQFLTHLDKRYRATMKLGVETDSQDGSGNVTTRDDNPERITAEDIKATMAEFTGKIGQIPPMFSAKKKNGVPLYRLARNGMQVDRAPVEIRIYALEFLHKRGNEVVFEIHCSSGTYIRTLCHDIGRKLGCGAYMKNLIRTSVGNFDLRDAVSLKCLERAMQAKNLAPILIPDSKALGFLPEVVVREPFIKAVSQGRPLSKEYLEIFPDRFEKGSRVRVSTPDHGLLAVAESVIDRENLGKMQPQGVAFKLKRVFN